MIDDSDSTGDRPRISRELGRARSSIERVREALKPEESTALERLVRADRELAGQVAATQSLASAASEQLAVDRSRLQLEAAEAEPRFVPGTASRSGDIVKAPLENVGADAVDVRLSIGDEVVWHQPFVSIGNKVSIRAAEIGSTMTLSYRDISGQKWSSEIRITDEGVQVRAPDRIWE